MNKNDGYAFSEEDLFLGNYAEQVQVDDWLPLETDIELGNRAVQLFVIPGTRTWMWPG